jgi:hypothetical protein
LFYKSLEYLQLILVVVGNFEARTRAEPKRLDIYIPRLAVPSLWWRLSLIRDKVVEDLSTSIIGAIMMLIWLELISKSTFTISVSLVIG